MAKHFVIQLDIFETAERFVRVMSYASGAYHTAVEKMATRFASKHLAEIFLKTAGLKGNQNFKIVERDVPTPPPMGRTLSSTQKTLIAALLGDGRFMIRERLIDCVSDWREATDEQDILLAIAHNPDNVKVL
jgi:hypothetical protein